MWNLFSPVSQDYVKSFFRVVLEMGSSFDGKMKREKAVVEGDTANLVWGEWGTSR